MTDRTDPRHDQTPPRDDLPVETEGVDRAALGMEPLPGGAPPGAEVDDSQHLVPGADHGNHPATEAKPWFTSLAAESEQAGVGNDPDAESFEPNRPKE